MVLSMRKKEFLKSVITLFLIIFTISIMTACQKQDENSNDSFYYKTAYFGYEYATISNNETVIEKYRMSIENNAERMPALFKKIHNPEEQALVSEDFKSEKELYQKMSKYDNTFFDENSLVLMAYQTGPFQQARVENVLKKDAVLDINIQYPKDLDVNAVTVYALILLEVKKEQIVDITKFSITND